MTELEKKGIYACALPMPGFDNPSSPEWINEIKRYVEQDTDDEIYLVGHSLGSTSILRYLENPDKRFNVSGAVLISTPTEKTVNKNLDSFFEHPFDFKSIKSNCKSFSIIHGDNDTHVSINEGINLAKALETSLIIIPNGGHLSGREGWYSLPQCLEALMKIFQT